MPNSPNTFNDLNEFFIVSHICSTHVLIVFVISPKLNSTLKSTLPFIFKSPKFCKLNVGLKDKAELKTFFKVLVITVSKEPNKSIEIRSFKKSENSIPKFIAPLYILSQSI